MNEPGIYAGVFFLGAPQNDATFSWGFRILWVIIFWGNGVYERTCVCLDCFLERCVLKKPESSQYPVMYAPLRIQNPP